MFEDSLPGDATFRYHGTGTLVDRRLGTMKCGFEAAQFREGTIRLRCIVPSLLFYAGTVLLTYQIERKNEQRNPVDVQRLFVDNEVDSAFQCRTTPAGNHACVHVDRRMRSEGWPTDVQHTV